MSTDRQGTISLPELMNVGEVAAYLRLHRATVVEFARQGKLPAFKVGREWRFRADDIKAWLEQQSRSRETFEEWFDRVRERIGQAMAQSGYTVDDVPRLIAEVRRERRERRGVSRA